MFRSSALLFRLASQRTTAVASIAHRSTAPTTTPFPRPAFTHLRSFKMSAPAAEPTLYKDEVTGEMVSKS